MAKAKPKVAPGSGKPRKGGGIVSLLVAVVLVTTVAGGAGFLAGNAMRKPGGGDKATAPKLAAAKTDADGLQVVPLPAIVTNLAGAEGGWIRLEAVVVVEGRKPIGTDLASRLAQDVTALLRTLSIRQITGSSGFQHLREELLDRMRARSPEKVRDVMIQSLVIE